MYILPYIYDDFFSVVVFISYIQVLIVHERENGKAICIVFKLRLVISIIWGVLIIICTIYISQYFIQQFNSTAWHKSTIIVFGALNQNSFFRPP